MNPPNCPGCAAPLDPLAPKCPYCGHVTPRGRADAERADYDARQRQAGQAAYASIAHAQASQNVSKNANIALVMSLAGFVTCCSPIGWIGLFFVYLSLSTAKKNAIPAPVTAKIAIGITAIGTILAIGVMIASSRDAEKKEKRIAELEATKGRTAEVIDQKTACGLAEAHMLRSGKLYISQQLSCSGKVEVTGATARLDDVAILVNGKRNPQTYRVCLAKGARWFLVHLDEGKEDCLDEAPKADNEGEEQVARDDYAQLLDAQRVHSADKRLAAVKAAVDRAPTTEKACTEAAIAAASTKKEKTKGATVVRAVDYALLDGKDDPDFSFLSNAELARYVGGKKKPVSARTDDARLVLGDALVVVYKHKARAMTEVTDKGSKAAGWTVTPGNYDGALYVVDAGRGEVLCQGPLTFTTPAKPTFSVARSSSQAQVEGRARTDYEQRFHDAATDRIKAIGSGKLGLGYKPLE